ncbi:MAG: HDOD domain-containing protein, partial [Bryobacteraceae bacterium]
MSNDSGVESHCRRVAALAVEIARRLRLPDDAQETVEQAALFHHTPMPLLDPPSLDRMMTDLCGKGWWRMEEMEFLVRALPAPVLDALRSLHAPPVDSQFDCASVVAEIVAVANLFDEQMEMLPFDNKTVEQILDDFRAMSEGEFFLPEIVLGLMSIPHTRMDSLLELANSMRLGPAAALRALNDTASLEELAASSQMLNVALLERASAGQCEPASTEPQATRRNLMVAAMRPFFAAARRPDLWEHSLLVAQLTEHLAVVSGCIDPSEAFLAGLVHDAGRVVLDRLTGEAF